MKLTLGFSSCPNDTFIFDAIVHQKIDTEGLDFDIIVADVEKLNKWSFQKKLDVTKLSYHAFSYVVNEYALIDAGSALGNNCGPLLIKKPETKLNSESRIAIPGKYTTANMLLSLAYPKFKNTIETLFSEIEDNIISNKVDAGLIIHENRFTYYQKGLEKVSDLGEYWENKTNLPIPLGGIMVKRDIPILIRKKIEKVLKNSINYAFQNRLCSADFIKSHCKEMKQEVIDSHINLYVNNYSLGLGDKGIKAIKTLFQELNQDISILEKDIA
mgnify:CR=1 FL=1|tara:strand:- start:331 stop:1143 length:813 start_codon:yes stop_codon:yes gene_type:complete